LIMQATDKDISKRSITAILRIVQLGRSCGVHLIIGTQTINQYVLRHEIAGNIEGRVCYHVKTKSSSILAIGTDDASELHLPGRAIFDRRGTNVVVQSPFYAPLEVDVAIHKLSGSNYEQISPEMFWRAALENCPMNVAGKTMQKAINEVWGIKKVYKFLSSWEFCEANKWPVLEVDGEKYILLSNALGREDTDRALIPAIPEILDILKSDMAAMVPPSPLADIENQGGSEGYSLATEVKQFPETEQGKEVLDKGYTDHDVAMALVNMIYFNLDGLGRFDDIVASDTGLSRPQIQKALKQLEYDTKSKNVLEIDGKRFLLTKTLNGFAPRYLMPVNGHLPENDLELVKMTRDYWSKNYANRNKAVETTAAA